MYITLTTVPTRRYSSHAHYSTLFTRMHILNCYSFNVACMLMRTATMNSPETVKPVHILSYSYGYSVFFLLNPDSMFRSEITYTLILSLHCTSNAMYTCSMHYDVVLID